MLHQNVIIIIIGLLLVTDLSSSIWVQNRTMLSLLVTPNMGASMTSLQMFYFSNYQSAIGGQPIHNHSTGDTFDSPGLRTTLGHKIQKSYAEKDEHMHIICPKISNG